MATKKDIPEGDLGIEKGYTTPVHEGPHTDALQPEHHENEYAQDGSKLRSGHGIQHSFPAGARYGGEKGSGVKKPGSEGGKK